MADLSDIDKLQSDHDLLVRLDERSANIEKALLEIKDSTKIKNEDHEQRLRTLEAKQIDMESSARTWRFVLTTAISLVGLAVGIIGLIISF
jgi:hypothetical protein